MTNQPPEYDCAIIGAGIAGLSLAIVLTQAGKKVVLFEQEEFPFHKVSGGYFSNEGLAFLTSLGVDLSKRNLPEVEHMIMTSPNGQSIKVKLDLGGVGINRYELDHELYIIAMAAGAAVKTGTRVRTIKFEHERFELATDTETITARTAAGAFGRSSNMDVALRRNYKAKKEQQLFVAVEHHIRIPYDGNFVELHAFPGGYCGISAYGDDLVNLSYITKAANLKAHKGINGLEKEVLLQNKYLRRYFEEGTFVHVKPQTISHVYFKIKEPVKSHLLMIGDAAGNIAPISGNGMSIATHSAKLASEAVLQYLNGTLSFRGMEQLYTRNYYNFFRKRIRVSRQLTHLLIHPWLINTVFPFFRCFPFLVDFVSRQIHGGQI